MLPAIAYERDEDSLSVIKEVAWALKSGLGACDFTSDPSNAKRLIAQTRAVVLFIDSVRTSDEKDAGLVLARYAQSQNRESYIVLTLPNIELLDAALDGNIRVCGMLVKPFTRERAAQVIKRIVLSYNNEGLDDEKCLVLQTGSSHTRVPVRCVLYVEAQEKKLSVWTRRQCISVYGTLAQLETDLPEGFMRCHRSYIVRLSAIQSVNYPDMEITVRGGARIPMARSRKADIQNWMENNAGEASDE